MHFLRFYVSWHFDPVFSYVISQNLCKNMWMETKLIISTSYHRKRRPQAAASSALVWRAQWGRWPACCPMRCPPTGWALPQSRSSWTGSHKSRRRKWPRVTLGQCWSHWSCVSGWTSYPWRLRTRWHIREKKTIRGQLAWLKKKQVWTILGHLKSKDKTVKPLSS